jgi:hypothetical protein
MKSFIYMKRKYYVDSQGRLYYSLYDEYPTFLGLNRNQWLKWVALSALMAL